MTIQDEAPALADSSRGNQGCGLGRTHANNTTLEQSGAKQRQTILAYLQQGTLLDLEDAGGRVLNHSRKII